MAQGSGTRWGCASGRLPGTRCRTLVGLGAIPSRLPAACGLKTLCSHKGGSCCSSFRREECKESLTLIFLCVCFHTVLPFCSTPLLMCKTPADLVAFYLSLSLHARHSDLHSAVQRAKLVLLTDLCTHGSLCPSALPQDPCVATSSSTLSSLPLRGAVPGPGSLRFFSRSLPVPTDHSHVPSTPWNCLIYIFIFLCCVGWLSSPTRLLAAGVRESFCPAHYVFLAPGPSHSYYFQTVLLENLLCIRKEAKGFWPVQC